ncbi:MAG: phosphatase PAP2 family protein [Phycisphaerales bacterium]
MRWLFRQEAGVLIAAAVVAAMFWAFAEIADEVLEGETDTFDRRVLLALRSGADPSRPIGPGWLVVAAEELTALGSASVLTLLTAAVVGGLWLRGTRRTALFVFIAVAGGSLVSTGLKLAFGQERPDVVPHLTHFATPSFPSGHAMLATVAYLTLGALVAEIQPRVRLRVYIIGVAVTTAVLVGATRVYLGVHTPSDVAAGWVGGAGWAAGCWGAARWLRLRRLARSESGATPGASGA